MATGHKNLSTFSKKIVGNMSNKRFGIVVSEWNDTVTNALLQGAMETLIEIGVQKTDIIVNYVPGTFELAFGAQRLAQLNDIDSVITLGCVIQGETRHFDFICDAAANGIMEVGLRYDKPVIFGVLTTENQQQALDRCGGKHGNKGAEAAITAIKMLG
jgi:6,7-dimethyl-8-ribityllumazine synthase